MIVTKGKGPQGLIFLKLIIGAKTLILVLIVSESTCPSGYLGVMDVLAMGNVSKAAIPMYKIRYVCFYFMFLYSTAVFISLAKGGPEQEQKLMTLKNSIVKHHEWNLIIKLGHHHYITPLPRWDLQNTQNIKSFPPHQWDKVFRKKSSMLRNLQSSVLRLHSPSPHSQYLSN